MSAVLTSPIALDEPPAVSAAVSPAPPAPRRSFDLARVDEAAPGWLALAGALSGHLVLGACFALGRGIRTGGELPLPAVFGTLGAQVGGLLFATPALLVLHPLLGLHARPEALLRAIAWAVVRHGRMALATVPVALVFAAAGRVTTIVHLLCFYALGGLGCWMVLRATVAAELQARPRGAEGVSVLAFGWVVLVAAVGLSLFLAGKDLVR